MAHTEQSLSVLSKDDLARLVLDYKGKFERMLKTVMDDICDLIHQFTDSSIFIKCTRVRAPY